jgi:hypothetical protein
VDRRLLVALVVFVLAILVAAALIAIAIHSATLPNTGAAS